MAVVVVALAAIFAIVKAGSLTPPGSPSATFYTLADIYQRLTTNEEAPEEVLPEKKIIIQRYKGLGEMNPDQLWETTMDPKNRVMKQVTIEDAEKADETFDILMGDEVEPRKRFIHTHAKAVKNLDI